MKSDSQLYGDGRKGGTPEKIIWKVPGILTEITGNTTLQFRRKIVIPVNDSSSLHVFLWTLVQGRYMKLDNNLMCGDTVA